MTVPSMYQKRVEELWITCMCRFSHESCVMMNVLIISWHQIRNVDDIWKVFLFFGKLLFLPSGDQLHYCL